MDSWSRLPVELVVQILSSVPRQTQFAVRLVNRQLEQVVTAITFASVKTCFRPGSFRHLESISRSPHLARHVKSFEYVFVGLYSTPMSFAHFETLIHQEHNSNLPLLFAHYREQLSIHDALSKSECPTLTSALSLFPDLRGARLTLGAVTHAYSNEPWASALLDMHLGATNAHTSLTCAIRTRSQLPHTSPVTTFCARYVPHLPSFRDVLALPLSALTTLDVRVPRPRWTYARYPRAPLGTATLSNLTNVRNLRFCVDNADTTYRDAAFIPSFPLGVPWCHLSVLVLKGFKFVESEFAAFVRRCGALRVVYLCDVAVVGKGCGGVGRMMQELRGAGVEGWFEAPCYVGVEGQGLDVVAREEYGSRMEGWKRNREIDMAFGTKLMA